MKIVALDFETSGLTPGFHAPISLGAAHMDGERILDTREWLFAPPRDGRGRVKREYSIAAMEVSSISWPRIKRDGLAAAEVVSQLQAFVEEWNCREVPIVCFNAAFDFAWFSDVLFLAGSRRRGRFRPAHSPLLGAWNCAYMRASAALDLASCTLESVGGHFGLNRQAKAHGALEDAILAGRIWHRLTEPLAGP